MAAGLGPTRTEIDTQAGVIARSVQKAMNDVREFKYYLDGKTDQQLLALGYVQAEVDDLRSAYADLYALTDVYRGSALVAVLKDFRTFARRIFGMGDV